MQLTQRQIGLGLLGLMTCGIGVILVILVFTGADTVTFGATAAATIIFGAIWFAYWRNWRYAPQTLVITTALLTMLQQEPHLTQQVGLPIFVAPVIALILLSPAWVLASAAAIYSVTLIRAGAAGVYADPLTIVLYAMVIGGMVLSRLVTDTALKIAAENAKRAEEARNQAEAHASENAQRADELATRNTEQQRLLDLVATLETPAVNLANGVLLAPVVGHLDSRRAQALTERLLQEVNGQRTRLVVLDIAGVSAVDTAVAQALLRTAQALRLLGCEVTITGISASVATTITHLGINLEGVSTARTPQEALQVYISDFKTLSKNGNGNGHYQPAN